MYGISRNLILKTRCTAARVRVQLHDRRDLNRTRQQEANTLPQVNLDCPQQTVSSVFYGIQTGERNPTIDHVVGH